ncbi:MAG: hypothetical protein H7256_04175 [Bdellovibrio sp.]|nr:hypothetical protein [Bdellovibrio sp.]
MMDTSFDTGTTCTPAGRQRFNAGAMQFCDGTYWHSMDGGTTTTQCVVAGAQIVTRSHTQLYCDGSSWHGMNNSGLAPTVTCMDIMSSNHCLPANGCSWNNGGCFDPNDCATRPDPPSCGVNPNCSWNAGACASNI